ncbi:MAG: alpha/beta hydrolase, partial [Candidatus Eremiobacteraeota bacterium]|nr:alpha/beta hydrolase [Candidatus Eremiobacteraeota bacterium]
ADASAQIDPGTTAQWYYEDMTIDSRPSLKNANVPILEVAPYDPSIDARSPASLPTAAAKQSYYQSLLAGAPNAKVVIVTPSRHFMMYDRPAQLDAALAAFFQSLP